VIASLPGVGLEVSRRPLLFEVVSADVVGLKFKVPNLDSAEIALWFSLVAVEQRILELQYRFFLASCILLLLGVVAVFYLCSRVQRGVGNLCEVVVGMLQGFDLSIDHVPSQRVSRELVGLRNLITKLFQRLGEVDSAETKASPKDEVFFQASREEMVNFDGLLNSTPEVVNGDDSAAAASGLVVIPVPIQGGQVSVEAPSSDGFSDLDSLTLETEYVPWDSEAGTVIKKEDPSLMGGIATWDEFRLETNLSVSSEEFDEVADNLDVEVPLSSPVGGGIATSVMEVSPELIEKLRLADGFEDAKEAEADFKRLYDLFLSERQGCGQQGLVDYDKFVERLKASESKVRSQKPNANVRFEIYRKDGRAAIRAIPS